MSINKDSEQRNNTINYEQLAEQHSQAYNAFTEIDGREHPEPKKPRWYAGLPLVALPFIIIAVASVLLSSLRTGPVFLNSALELVDISLALTEAILAVLSIELFFVSARFFLILNQYRKTGVIDDVKWWTGRGFWLAFAVAISANLFATIQNEAAIESLSPIISLAFSLVIGASIPILAFISGDILGVFWVTAEQSRKLIKESYDAAHEAWEAGRERRWNAQKSTKYGIKNRLEEAEERLSARTDNRQTANRQQTPFATSDKQPKHIALEYLKKHPDKKFTVRGLADAAGVTNDAAHKALNAYSQNGHSSNGNSGH